MLKSELVIGGRYKAHLSYGWAVVKLIEIQTGRATTSMCPRPTTRYIVANIKNGKRSILISAIKLHRI